MGITEHESDSVRVRSSKPLAVPAEERWGSAVLVVLLCYALVRVLSIILHRHQVRPDALDAGMCVLVVFTGWHVGRSMWNIGRNRLVSIRRIDGRQIGLVHDRYETDAPSWNDVVRVEVLRLPRDSGAWVNLMFNGWNTRRLFVSSQVAEICELIAQNAPAYQERRLSRIEALCKSPWTQAVALVLLGTALAELLIWIL